MHIHTYIPIKYGVLCDFTKGSKRELLYTLHVKYGDKRKLRIK